MQTSHRHPPTFTLCHITISLCKTVSLLIQLKKKKNPRLIMKFTPSFPKLVTTWFFIQVVFQNVQ